MDIEIGKVFSHKTSATKSFQWSVIEFDENDWDTPSKILHLNEQDAAYNNMELDFMTRITLG